MDRPQLNETMIQTQAKAAAEGPAAPAASRQAGPQVGGAGNANAIATSSGNGNGNGDGGSHESSRPAAAAAAAGQGAGNGRGGEAGYGSEPFAAAGSYGDDFDDLDSGFGRPYGGFGGPDDEMSAVQRDAAQGVTEHDGVVGKAIEALRSVYDPEIPVNIYDLGLIYEVKEVEPGMILVRMTLTSPMCPVAGSLPPEVKHRVESAPGVKEAIVDIVWDPPWSPNKMSEAARLQLNFF